MNSIIHPLPFVRTNDILSNGSEYCNTPEKIIVETLWTEESSCLQLFE